MHVGAARDFHLWRELCVKKKNSVINALTSTALICVYIVCVHVQIRLKVFFNVFLSVLQEWEQKSGT